MPLPLILPFVILYLLPDQCIFPTSYLSSDSLVTVPNDPTLLTKLFACNLFLDSAHHLLVSSIWGSFKSHYLCSNVGCIWVPFPFFKFHQVTFSWSHYSVFNAYLVFYEKNLSFLRARPMTLITVSCPQHKIILFI